MEMSRWTMVVAVALAAVVGLVPAFAQVSYAQSLPEPVSVLPFGEELPDEELLEVEGALFGVLIFLVGCLLAGAVAGFMAYFFGGASPWEAAAWGASAMLILVIGVAGHGLPPYVARIARCRMDLVRWMS